MRKRHRPDIPSLSLFPSLFITYSSVPLLVATCNHFSHLWLPNHVSLPDYNLFFPDVRPHHC